MRPRRRGGNNPARRGSGGVRCRRGAQQKGADVPLPGRKRKPARSDKIEPIDAAEFSDHHADGAAAQRLFHGPQHVPGFRRGNPHQPLGGKPEIVEPGPVGRAVLEKPHVLGDPQHRARLFPVRGKPQGKVRRGRDCALGRGGDLVQGGTCKPTAKRLIDWSNPERDRSVIEVRLKRAEGMPERAQDLPASLAGGRSTARR